MGPETGHVGLKTRPKGAEEAKKGEGKEDEKTKEKKLKKNTNINLFSKGTGSALKRKEAAGYNQEALYLSLWLPRPF